RQPHDALVQQLAQHRYQRVLLPIGVVTCVLPRLIVSGTVSIGPSGQRAANSSYSLLMHVRVAHAVPSARPQIVVPGMMPIVFSSSSSISRSFARPPPSTMRSRIFRIHALPSRQGVHWPQLSCE